MATRSQSGLVGWYLPGSLAKTLGCYWATLQLVPAQRGAGTVLLGPADIDNITAGGAALIAPPGVLLRNPSSEPDAYSDNGWRIAYWYPNADGRVAQLDEVRPDERLTLTLSEVRAWAHTRAGDGDIDAEAWTQDALHRAIATWLGLLRPGGRAAPALRQAALTRVEEALMDAAGNWGDSWRREHGTDQVWQALAEARRELSGDERGAAARARVAYVGS
jgi:hypothetical protein